MRRHPGVYSVLELVKRKTTFFLTALIEILPSMVPFCLCKTLGGLSNLNSRCLISQAV